jgi:hypothetical protein
LPITNSPNIEAIHPEGRISARLATTAGSTSTRAIIIISTTAMPSRVIAPRGITAERFLIHADTSIHPDLLNCHFGYVSISLASHEATLFTDDMAKLGPQLEADVSKTSALEITQGPCAPFSIPG